jgi:tetratricopeptide (TPR) repeat protein
LLKKPTQNPAAYNLFLRGLDYLNIVHYGGRFEEFKKAKQCFELAVKLDSTFSEAYVRLAHIYIDLLYGTTPDRSIQLQYLDSGIMIIKKVFLYDTNNVWAYHLRGNYYYNRTGMVEKANIDWDKAFELSNKNEYTIYYTRFWQFWDTKDYVNALSYFYQGKELQPKEELTIPALLEKVSECLVYLGHPEIARKYAEEFLKQTNDSLGYFYKMAEIERTSGNFKNAVIYDLKCNEIDNSKTTSLYYLRMDYILLRDYKNANKYLIALENEFSRTGKDFKPEIFSGYIYLKNGEPKKADYHLKGSAKELLKDIESNGIDAQQFYSHWNLAKIYSIMGEKRKALDNLKMLKNRKKDYSFLALYLNHFPFFDFIRDEPEFIEVLKDVEAKYQAEHDRAGKLLKEHGKL